MKKVGYPTVDDVLDETLKTVSGEFRENVKEMACVEFIVKQHFHLGTTIQERYF